jgi:1,4-dihydroxy-2-naphthoate octaprenyltransferase
MVIITYGVGAAIASAQTGHFNWTLCILGWACLFLIELATVMSNEYLDYASDRVNENAGPFTGGSRMLVDGPLSFPEVRRAIIAVLILFVAVATALITILPPERRLVVTAWLLLGVALGLGYTAAPLRLSYRGLGEIDVAFTHSAYVILVGYVVQTGVSSNPLPWLVSIPSFLAVLSANTLAGIPDHAADASVNKRSLSVLLGHRAAAVVAIISALAASVTGVWLWRAGVVDGRIGTVFALTVVHAIALAAALLGFLRSGNYDRRIDPIMINALNFIIWFGILPLIYFATQ